MNEIQEMRAKVNATMYIECSAKTGQGIDELLKQAIILTKLSKRKFGKAKKKSSGPCLLQ